MSTLVSAPATSEAAPVSLHPKNPHYLLFRGRPTVLIGSTEHYGAVLNQDFDYHTYLKELEKSGLNLTRTFSGAYMEDVASFGITHNTLAPLSGRLLCPWARSSEPGYAGGGAKLDLDAWDPAYFERLKDFVSEASKRGVIVEYVFFCPFYEDGMWDLSPMKSSNNVNGVGDLARTDVYTLKDAKLTAVQDAMVRKVVEELQGFDNLYYEICNEPYFGGVTLEWQRHISQVIADAEAPLKQRHLIAQNIANNTAKIEDPDPRVSIFNFHYARPPEAVETNYALNRVLADDETGFDGSADRPYRQEAWEFLMAGGGIYDNLDYSFSVGHEKGDGEVKAPGGGGPALRKQLKVLRDFLRALPLLKMAPDTTLVRKINTEKATARALSEPGKIYAIYVKGDSQASLTVELAPGTYESEWLNTKTGKIDKQETFSTDKGWKRLVSPAYLEDIVVRVKRTGD
ncbi:MAG TPA: hypothetical protein VGN26_16620 [Armatimonadota bacterium]|jgi:hypothetical protein